jgi:threonine dehydrogenase-like Zn-dependent dehydrogenase
MRVRSRAVVLGRFGQELALDEFDVPAPEEGAALAAVARAGVCGTDVHLHHGHLPIPTPVVLGHEAVGRIAELGPGLERDALGQPLAVGDRVTWASSIVCGSCDACRQGEPTLCGNRVVYGINQRADVWPHLSGGWADYVYLRPGSTIVRLPDGVGFDDAIALGCAGPTVVHGLLHRAGIRPGQTVIVQGSGPVGLAAAIYAQLGGADRVLVVGGPAARLEQARELGIGDLHVDVFEVADEAERRARLLAATPGGRGADLVVECTGVPAAVAEGLELVRPAGTYLVLGQYTDRGPTPINPHLITRGQLRVLGSWGLGPAHVVEYASSLPGLLQRFEVGRLVTRYPLAAANQALADAEAGRVTKAVLEPAAGSS